MKLLATVAECKVMAKIATATDDALVAMLAEAVACSIQTHLGIELENDGTYRTEYFRGSPANRGRVKLIRRPVALNNGEGGDGMPILSLYEDISGAFDSSTLIATDEYDLNVERGVIQMRFRPFLDSRNARSIKVVYKGGYEETGPSTGVLDVPDAIRLAALKQFAFEWHRKESPAARGLSTAFGNISFLAPTLREDVIIDLAPFVRRDM